MSNNKSIRLSIAALAAAALCGDSGLPMASAFVPAFVPNSLGVAAPSHVTTTSTSLHMALGVLARKAKEASLREYVKAGLEDSVRAKVDELKKAAATDSNLDPHPTDAEWSAGPVQAALTKRKGTITVIAEYKRKMDQSGFIDEVFNPEILSPSFREFGATAVAVMADDRIGGCTYDDVAEFVKEQQGAKGEMPGPLPVISSDIIVDELQLCQSAAYGAEAVVLMAGVIGMDKCRELKKYADLLQLECIVAVGTKEEAQQAVSDVGATIVMVSGVEGGADDKYQVVDGLDVPEGKQICTVANILARDNKALEEVEEAWVCRDRGFNAVWLSDALYKSGADPQEHPGAIISACKAKSSVKWASPKARSGKGEGAREYLGDLLM